MKTRILEFIQQNPQTTTQDIVAALDIAASTASRPLNELLVHGKIICRRGKHGKCYWIPVSAPENPLPPKPIQTLRTLHKVREIKSIFEFA